MIGTIINIVIAVSLVSQYGAGRAESVIRVRQTPGKVSKPLPVNLPPVDGYLAVLDCNRIGDVVYLRHVDEHGNPLSLVESFLIIDCAANDGTPEWMQHNGIYGEIDHATAVKWNTLGRGAHVEIITPSRHQWY